MKDLKEAVKEIQGFQNEARRARFYLELGPYKLDTLLNELTEKLEEGVEDIEALTDTVDGLNEMVLELEVKIEDIQNDA